MTKQELVKSATAKIENATQKDVSIVLDSILESIKEELVKGGKVTLVGFGNFEVAERAARKGRNPKTSEEIMIPASKAPKFKAGKVLKDAVNA
ncbi:MAG: HU family DNA-binding protein [Alphaproteobacteria bacterium]|jgi:DNA-binding protein HU-beta|nr:HU family DNA-binding protein [Alphaproteobacteria bacterium]